jgi:hypothetical protein
VAGAGSIVAVASSIARVTSHGISEESEKRGKGERQRRIVSSGRASERVPPGFIGAQK